MQFIKSRFNKDNFWNLVFWFGMTIGLTITVAIDIQNNITGLIVSWSTILGVPFIVCKGSKITVDKKELKFFDRTGSSLENRLPHKFGSVILLTAGIVALVGAILDSHKNTPELLGSFIVFGTIFLVPTLYFICINCPIAVLFKRHIWSIISKNWNTTPYNFSNSSSSSISKNNSNPITDLSYSGSSSNIHSSRYR